MSTCPFCDATLAADPRVVFAAAYLRAIEPVDASRSDLVEVASVPYVLEGLLARGESTDVFLGRRARRPTERVVLKVLRALDDEDLLRNEASVLDALHRSDAPGAEHFTARLPQPVARGVLVSKRCDPRPTSIHRFASGFVHTFDDVRAAHGEALDPRHAVWMWRRVLELLGFVHAAGWVHGAILPHHLLVHARDHGVLAVGWSLATRIGGRLPAVSANHSSFYPSRDATPALDVAMSARSVLALLGSATPPAPLSSLLARCANGDRDDAWGVDRDLVRAARVSFGPPTYVSLSMPGA